MCATHTLIFVKMETHFWTKIRFQAEAQAHSEMAFVLRRKAIRKIRAIFSSKQKPKQNQSRLARIRYPARRTSFMYLLLV